MSRRSSERQKKFKMSEKMTVGPPTLKARDLDRMLGFYEGIFGLEKVGSETQEGSVVLGLDQSATQSLLVLRQNANAKPSSEKSAGLYHYAITVPDRRSLALAYSSLTEDGIRFDGLVDHIVAESLYLHDPENNGIEIYRDRPRSYWFDADGNWKMGAARLDIEGILGELEAADVVQLSGNPTVGVFPNGTAMGHLHLRVTDLEKSTRFYHERLGLNISIDMSENGVVFLSASDYHHHIALNTWNSLGGKRLQPNDLGLDSIVLNIPASDTNKKFLDGLKTSLENAKFDEEKNEVSSVDPDGISVKIVGIGDERP